MVASCCSLPGTKAPKPAKNVDHYPMNDGSVYTGIDFPRPFDQIEKLKKRRAGLAINVFGRENEKVHPLFNSDKDKAIPRINLMMHDKHYTLIKDLNRLLFDQSKHKERKQFCARCLIGFSREDLLTLNR